jgi:hypothetical protein
VSRAAAVARDVSMIGVGAFIGLVLAWFLIRPSHRVIAEWPQSEPYPEGAYRLRVLEGGIEPWTLGWPRRHFVFVTRMGDDDYGHGADFSFGGFTSDVEATIRSTSVAWARDGVRIDDRQGHRLWIAKERIVGGR